MNIFVTVVVVVEKHIIIQYSFFIFFFFYQCYRWFAEKNNANTLWVTRLDELSNFSTHRPMLYKQNN